MRVLLDACLHEGLRHVITGHTVATARYAGLGALVDRDLLDAAEQNFDVLVTGDSGIRYQQNFDGRSLAVVVLRAKSNRLADLLPLIPSLDAALAEIRAGEVVEIGS
jgi:predicted nuclease of predicted toxin-antitoxin system